MEDDEFLALVTDSDSIDEYHQHDEEYFGDTYLDIVEPLPRIFPY